MTEWTQLTYTPGRWVAVAAAGQWLLVDLAAEDPVVRRCWKLMSERAGVDAVLDALLSGGVALAPGFALVSLRDGEHRVVSRFPAAAVLHRPGAEAGEIAGTEGASWTDVLLGDAALEGVTLRGLLSTDSSVELPMGAGVITAGIVHVSAGTPAPSAASPEMAPRRPAPQPPAVQPLEQHRLEPFPQSTSVQSAPVQSTSVQSAQAQPDGAPPDDQPSYDFLFGATVRPDEVSRPGVTADYNPPEESSGSAAPQNSGTEPLLRDEHAFPLAETLIPLAGGTQELERPVEQSGLIDAVPWLDKVSPTPPLPPAAAPAPVPPASNTEVSTGQVPLRDVSATVNRAELRSAAVAGATGPTVLAGYCPCHHLSPPHAARCRVCSAPMPQQTPFEIVRPALGVLRLESGEVITLDRGVVLGRSPESPDGDSAERPHIVRLASPENDISRTHAEVLLDGWNVYLRDFGSMNGTVITLPGQPPERLRENNPQLLENGTVITLADEVSLTFEVTA